jgi:ribA/ribD-fused uncharacterized protein
METEDSIYFYGIKNDYAYMSNFYQSTFYENKIKYNCSEQYFMYYKCLTFDTTNNELLEKILNESSPTKIKKLGRSVNNYNEEIWSNKRYEIMVNALRLKFSQNDNIKDKLLKTENKNLYEASQFDRIWGIGYSAKNAIKMNLSKHCGDKELFSGVSTEENTKDKSKFGNNLLGKALMEIRNELKN